MPTAPAVTNLLESLPAKQAEEFFEQLAVGRTFRVERIVSQGHHSPAGFWYEQPECEWVLVLQGNAAIEFERAEPQRVELRPGDSLMIPAYQRHRVAWSSPDEATIWLAIHFQPAAETE